MTLWRVFAYKVPTFLMLFLCHTSYKESTPLNKLAVADAVWARMPVDGLNMTLA